MHPKFWQRRWRNKQIQFHLQTVNPYILDYWGALNLPAEARVLVPLCGKSIDLLWLLEQRYEVVGVEIVEAALQEFAVENGLNFSKQTETAYIHWSFDPLHFYQGDIFTLEADLVGRVDAIYDRAALIAFPEIDRGRYARKLMQLLSDQGQVLLVTMEYPADTMDGPPFSVGEMEVRKLFSDTCKIEVLHQEEQVPGKEWQARGMQKFTDKVYKLSRI